MSRIEYHVSTAMLDWIAAKQATDRQGLADKVDAKKDDPFLQGILNKKQADQLTKLADIPFGFLFLHEPPADNFAKPTLPDFRTIQESDPLTNDFYAVLNDVLNKQDWYRDYLNQIGGLPERLPFVGRYTLNDTAQTIANDIAKTIGFDVVQRNQYGQEGYFRYISLLLENIGILVIKSGIVGSNTHRPLNAREFRGFALADKQVPVIFVNGADAPSAQLFTLLHETAHIWLGESGISNIDPHSNNAVEQLCNRSAAEFLVPHNEFLRLWNADVAINSNLTTLAQHFRVSTYVIAIKAVQSNLIDRQEWGHIRQGLLQKGRQAGGGGSAYTTIPVRNSKRFTQAVLRSAMSKAILLRDGAKLLNTTPKTLVQLYKRSQGDAI